MRKTIVAGIAAVLVLTALHQSIAQQGATYIKNAMCIACHKTTHKEVVENYQASKHAQAKPAEGMSPADIYRRVVGFNAADNTYYEAGVGCQACHGPGSAHMKGKTNEEKQAAIVRPQLLDTPQKKTSLCGRCHGDYTVDGKSCAANFTPGDDLFAMPGFKLNDVTTPGTFTILNDFMGSKHAQKDVTCITCHTPHGASEAEPSLRKKLPDQCLQCHADAHKGTDRATANCATCHMPGGRHLFVPPKQ